MSLILWIFCVLLHLVWRTTNSGYALGINIALHAQLSPSNDKIVGSVITTNGLRSAFGRRGDVGSVEVFYPAKYEGLLNRTWDVVFIEGWFPSIATFISLVRNHCPASKVVFICLDPTYPGLDVVSGFDVDGVATNSRILAEHFQPTFATHYVQLAADSNAMRPYDNVTRDWGAIYVGAGGPMLSVKPELRDLLLQALPYKLRLHGNGWQKSPEFASVALGPLPELELAPAYSSAEVVLASTIKSQSDFGMVNNRIFEALSCGAIVITAWRQELQDLGCRALLFVNSTHSVADHMTALRRDAAWAAALRAEARDFILQRHTWEHRAVQLLDFYWSLPPRPGPGGASPVPSEPASALGDVCGSVRCNGRNCQRLLWLVSPALRYHQDYVFVVRCVAAVHLCRMFHVVEKLPDEVFAPEFAAELRRFAVVMAVITPFDTLDRSMRSLGVLTRPDTFPGIAPLVQKHIAYLLGYNAGELGEYVRRQQMSVQSALSDEWSLAHYDSLWYRSTYDLALLQQLQVQLPAEGRLQHAFGVGKPPAAVDSMGVQRRDGRLVVVCFFTAASECGSEERSHLLRTMQRDYFDGSDDSSVPFVLLLLGGTWEGWLDARGGASGSPVVVREDLHRTVLVSDGQTSDAVSIVQGAEVVAVMNSAHDGQAGDVLDRCAVPDAGDILQQSVVMSAALDVLECHEKARVSTLRDVLWPLVAAAVAGRRIHLRYVSANIAHMVTEGGIDDWSGEAFLQRMVKVGCDRALGLGSVHSKFQVLRVVASGTESEFVSSFVASHQVGSLVGGTEIEPDGGNATVVVWLRLAYEHFEVGRDGEACVQHMGVVEEGDQESASAASNGRRGRNAPGERVCLMRPYRYLALQALRSASRRCDPVTPDDVTFFLRGPLFGDPFYSFAISRLSLFDSAHSFRAPVQWNSTWLESQHAFVYNVVECK